MNALTQDDLRRVDQVVELLRQSRSLLFITGAGLSADSGLPTYRGVGGLYNGCDPEEGVPIETLLSGEVLSRCPELTWKYLLQIEKACRSARPNRGHEIIAEMEKRFERVWVLTQNVDGFHRQAGSQNVIDIHGDLRRLRCTQCVYERSVTDYEGLSIPPQCFLCRAPMRPGVVLFGERLPEYQLMTYRAETTRGFDLVLSIGTTSVFPYISAPVLDAHHFQKPSVEINPGETDVTEFVTVKLPLGAATALEAIWTRYNA